MSKQASFKFDEIGYWSEVKLDIIRDYAAEYSKIITAQTRRGLRLHHVYIDGFAGPGQHIAKSTREFVPGSPMNVLLVAPPFCEYHFVDLHKGKVGALEGIAADCPSVKVHHGDCNEVLLNEVFPKVRYEDYRRGLCLLDPYGLHLDWKVIQIAGQMRSVEIFLNFPVMDMNMNVLWNDPFRERRPEDVERMNAFWGDESWRQVAYPTTGNLFGYPEKASNEVIAGGFRERLRKIAGFEYVPTPMPMRNNNGTIVYYLFFASQKPVAANIVEYIFDKYRTARVR